jgi:hypothetical protein
VHRVSLCKRVPKEKLRHPLKTKKRRFVYRESSLAFCPNSDMLTKVSVIFSFENFSLMARYFKRK